MTGRDVRRGAALAARDALLAIVSYAAAYVSRFPDAGLHAVRRDAVLWLPLISAAQIGGLAVAGRYARPSAARTVAGAVLGTAAGAAAGWLLLGTAGVSRLALVC